MKHKDLSPLEKYLLENREGLDQIEQVDVDGMWERVRSEVRGARSEKPLTHQTTPPLAPRPSPLVTRTSHPNNWHISIGRNWRWGIAASIVLAIGLYFLLPHKQAVADAVQLADMLPEIAQQEANYQRLIAQKEGEIRLKEIDKEAFSEIFMELQLLEEIHNEYLQDLPQYEKNDHLVSTLLRYYERKIKILERLSREIEKKKMNHEKINSEKHI